MTKDHVFPVPPALWRCFVMLLGYQAEEFYFGEGSYFKTYNEHLPSKLPHSLEKALSLQENVNEKRKDPKSLRNKL